jgi:hypothetical protein
VPSPSCLRLTHVGSGKSGFACRHKKPENLRRYFMPSPEVIAEVTGLLAPGDARR